MDTLTDWNGTWHEGNPAILGPRDHAFWLGSMVFDGARAFEGCGPDLDLHAERVVRSACALGLKPTKTVEEILKLMHEGVRRFGPKAELYVRPMFWATKGGQGPIPVDPESAQCRRPRRRAHRDDERPRRCRRDVHHRQCRQGPAGQPLREPRPSARPDRAPGARALHGVRAHPAGDLSGTAKPPGALALGC